MDRYTHPYESNGYYNANYKVIKSISRSKRQERFFVFSAVLYALPLATILCFGFEVHMASPRKLVRK